MKPSAPIRLLIIGDSVSLGAATIQRNQITEYVTPSFVDRLRETFPQLEIRIEAAVHRTTVEASNLIAGSLATHRPNLALIMVGCNDADLDWKRFFISGGSIARNRVPVARYSANLRRIVNACIAAGTEAILSDIPSSDLKARAATLPPMGGQDAASYIESHGGQPEAERFRAEYNQAVASIAAEFGLSVADYGKKMDTRPSSAFVGADSTHPNAAAHHLIADVLFSLLIHRFGLICARPLATACA